MSDGQRYEFSTRYDIPHGEMDLQIRVTEP